MPNYSFRNKETGEEFTKELKMSEREDFLTKNPELVQIFTSAPGLGDSIRLGFRKADGHFQDRLKQIKDSHYGSNINTGNITNI